MVAAALAILLVVFIALAYGAGGSASGAPGSGGDAGEGGSDARMVSGLASLGVPLDTGVTPPGAALAGGHLKATLWRGVQHLEAKRFADAVTSLDVAVGSAQYEQHPHLVPVQAAACFVRAQAHEAEGRKDLAAADYARALQLATAHAPFRKRAQDALKRLRGA